MKRPLTWFLVITGIGLAIALAPAAIRYAMQRARRPESLPSSAQIRYEFAGKRGGYNLGIVVAEADFVRLMSSLGMRSIEAPPGFLRFEGSPVGECPRYGIYFEQVSYGRYEWDCGDLESHAEVLPDGRVNANSYEPRERHGVMRR